MSQEDYPHYSTQVRCSQCGHGWVAVYPVTGEDCQALECPKCSHQNWIVPEPKPIHLVISKMNGALWIKPNRPVPRTKAIAMVAEALAMLTGASAAVLNPDDCQLRVFITVDDSQRYEEV